MKKDKSNNSKVKTYAKHTIAIVGGGPAAMMCACHLDPEKFKVIIYEKGKMLGSKFLVAGKGGFNLTHNEDIALMLAKYSGTPILEQSILSFDNHSLINWLKEIGIETFVGTSNRVFPIKEIKPIDVLNAFLATIEQNKVEIKTGSEWRGFENSSIKIFSDGEDKIIQADYYVYALGGSSWKKTGSDGKWTRYFENKGVEIVPFLPSNCSLGVAWKDEFITKNSGLPIKNISLTFQNKTIKGEIMITDFGIEGSPVYALSNDVIKEIKQDRSAVIHLDLKPSFSSEKIQSIIQKNQHLNHSKALKDKIHLSKSAVGLVKSVLTKEAFMDDKVLASAIKKMPISITSFAPIDQAISTTGGIPFSEIDENFQLNKIPDTFVIGEMLDWNAPTGGYLLQACFSMGKYVADKINSLYGNS